MCEPALIAKRTRGKLGHVKGQPLRLIVTDFENAHSQSLTVIGRRR